MNAFMKKTVLFLLVSFLCAACKKETNIVISPSSNIDAVEFKIDQVINDSTITLKWSKLSGAVVQKYIIQRRAYYQKNGQIGNFVERIDSSSNMNRTSFTETKMPLSNDILYELWISTDTTQFNQGLMYKAGVYYQRPHSLLYGIPTDVLINRQQKKLYVTEQNEISVVDYETGKLLTSRSFPISIGYCALGDFNGSAELYVPVNDGWLEILDATTLQVKEKIYVAGFGIGSVAAVNQKLYVSSSDRAYSGYANCIKIYDRATKILIGRTGYWDQTRLVPLEGTSVEMIDVTINLGPVGLFYYQFTPEGVLLSKKEDTYHGDYLMDPGIVRSFPDGSKVITSRSGTIFNKSLLFDRYVNQNGNYSDFAFNNDGSLIYAAHANQKKIDVVTYPATTTTNSYTTALYPYKIFRDGNRIISVSRTFINQQMTYLFVEKINL